MNNEINFLALRRFTNTYSTIIEEQFSYVLMSHLRDVFFLEISYEERTIGWNIRVNANYICE